MRIKNFKIYIGILISIILLYFALKGINWPKVGSILKSGIYLYLIPAVIIHFISFYIRSIKWSLIISKNKKVNPNELFPLITTGLAMNNILPLRAGEFARIIILANKFAISRINATISVLAERIFDILGLLIVILIFIRFYTWPKYINNFIDQSSILIIAFIILFPLFLYIFEKATNHKIFDNLLNKNKIAKYIKAKSSDFKEGYFLLHDINLVVKSVLLSIAIWILEGCSYFILSKMFSLNISLFNFIFVCAVINLSSAIPSSPGFIGTFEFFTVTILSFLGISKDLALSYTLILHIELLLPVTIVGIYFYFSNKYYQDINLKKLNREKLDKSLNYG